MSGLAATEYIMAHCPTPILVVSASINRGELFQIYDALAAGAVDVLEKPTGTEVDGGWERRFLATVKLVARIRVITHARGRLMGFRGQRFAETSLSPTVEPEKLITWSSADSASRIEPSPARAMASKAASPIWTPSLPAI